MNDLMSIKRVSSFVPVLEAYAKATGSGNDFDAIDGGAGSGGTSDQILNCLSPASTVYAFEPFPGNHRFFDARDPRIVLMKKALSESESEMTLKVHSVVSGSSEWGARGFAGYSSVGRLSPDAPNSDHDTTVQCVAADHELPQSADIGFVKLDLQGGELNALLGMKRILENVRLMWIEFSNQSGLFEFLAHSNFVLFDTEYLILGEKDPKALEVFDVSKSSVTLSTGRQAWFGFRKHTWMNFELEFNEAKESLNLVQTDLLCVNKACLADFIHASEFL